MHKLSPHAHCAAANVRQKRQIIEKHLCTWFQIIYTWTAHGEGYFAHGQGSSSIADDVDRMDDMLSDIASG